MSGEEYQPAREYPADFELAVLPGNIAPYSCDHDADPPVCVCVHDWRIHWGNKPKKTSARATYIQ